MSGSKSQPTKPETQTPEQQIVPQTGELDDEQLGNVSGGIIIIGGVVSRMNDGQDGQPI